MQVQFRTDITNALGEVIYRAGEKRHVETSAARTYIDRKEAVAVARAKRGTSDWLSEQAALEALRQAAIPPALKESVPLTPVWKVIRLDSGKIVVERTLGKEKLVYGEVPVFRGDMFDLAATEKRLVTNLAAASCPERVIDLYLAAKKAPDKLVIDRAQYENAVEAQARQHERERNAPRF